MTRLHLGVEYLEQLVRVGRRARNGAAWAYVNAIEAMADTRELRQRLLAMAERNRERRKS